MLMFFSIEIGLRTLLPGKHSEGIGLGAFLRLEGEFTAFVKTRVPFGGESGLLPF